MNGSRRSFVFTAAGTAGALIAAQVATAQRAPTPQPRPSPNAPTNEAVPEGFEHYPRAAQSDNVRGAFDATQVNAMVQQLYQLSSELKQEAEKTNLQKTLPIDFIKRAQQIEKLAKTIRQRLQA